MIETIYDYNRLIGDCGCCQLPICPRPGLQYEGQSAGKKTAGIYNSPSESDVGSDIPFGTAFDIDLWELHSETTHTRTLSSAPTVFRNGPSGNFKREFESSGNFKTIERYDGSKIKLIDCSTADDEEEEPTKTTEYSGSADIVTKQFSRADQNSPWILRNTNTCVITRDGEQEGDVYNRVCEYEDEQDPSNNFTTEQLTNPAAVSSLQAVDASISRSYSEDGMKWEDWLSEANVPFDLPEDCWGESPLFGQVSFSELIISVPDSFGGEGNIQVIASRFRFQIPTGHRGTYFTITYDIGSFPETGDPEILIEDEVIDWSGPGDQEDPDGESWFTSWVDIPIPTEPGRNRVVNIRYACRHGAVVPVFPQTMGEALEI